MIMWLNPQSGNVAITQLVPQRTAQYQRPCDVTCGTECVKHNKSLIKIKQQKSATQRC